MIISEDTEMGTRSMFGVQALSTRQSVPVLGFTKGGRTAKLADKALDVLQLGRGSPGPAYDITTGLGKRQVLSRCSTAPACTISQKVDPYKQAAKEAARPGPGAYSTDFPTIGHPVSLARVSTGTAVHIGRQRRFTSGAQKPSPSGVFSEPVLTAPRLPVGYLGDAPRWTFHGGRSRSRTGALISSGTGAADPPSFLKDPAPGNYPGAERSAFGVQVSSEATTAPAIKMPRSGRDTFLRQALTRQEEQVLLCRTSGGPAFGQASTLGRQVLSTKRSTSACGFGTSGRFCDRPDSLQQGRRASSAMGSRRSTGSNGGREEQSSRPGSMQRAGRFEVPGPGSYLV